MPCNATPSLLARLRQAGVSYVSVGVQSFDDRVLSYLGRDHDAQAAIRGLEAALAAGFACVDADLMFDVVRFGEDRVVHDAEIAFSLGVDQLSVYPMMRFDDDPQHDEPAEKRALCRIAQASGKLGYARSSVWTFGKNPKHRYSSITRERYVGLGPSGSSLVGGGQFYVNTFDVERYAELTSSGRLPIAAHIDLNPRAAELYDLFWRCYEGYIDPRRFSGFQAPLVLLRLAGVLRQHGAGYQLTERGFDLFQRRVTYQYIKPLWAACRAAPIPARISL